MIRVAIEVSHNHNPLTVLSAKNLRLANQNAAQGAYVATQKSLQKMGQETRSRSFYQEARDTITLSPSTGSETESTALINIPKKGIRLQWKGGTVVPVRRKNLLIPFKAGVGGGTKDSPILRKSIHEMKYKPKSVFVITSKKGNKILMLKKSKKSKMVGLGLLKPSVTIKRKERVIPSDAELTEASRKGFMLYLKAKSQ